jgi:thymidylate synthase
MKFKPVWISGTDLNDTWFQLLQGLYDNGRKYLITEGSYKGINRLVFDDVAGFISYPHTKPLAPIMPEGSNLPAPTTDHDIEMYFADYLMNSNIQDNEDYKYATFITGGEYQIPKGILYNVSSYKHYMSSPVIVPNQLEWIIKHFKEKGFGNEHCYISVGYPESNFAYDIPYNTEQERKTSPCLRGLDFRIIEDNFYLCPKCNKETYNFYYDDIHGNICPNCKIILSNSNKKIKYYLHTKVIYRSWDLWGGWPTNMGGFTLLNEYVASELEIEPGPLSFTCKSLHCYDFQLDVLKLRLGKGE